MKFAPSLRKSIRYSIFIGVLVGSVFSGTGAFAVDPTPIRNQAELEDIGNDTDSLNGNYVLAWTDPTIPLSVPTSGITYIDGDFTGTFDGGNGTLTGLTAPLFYTVSGEVKDLNLVTEAVDGVVGNGAVANILEVSGEINNVTVSGKVGAEIFGIVGGLVGEAYGRINNSTVSANVTGGGNVGGMVGLLSLGASITDSHTTGNVTSDGDSVGGLVGNSDGTITDSFATGDVSGRSDVGGLVGYSEGTITDSFATGDVSGEGYVGGLVGYSEGFISYSHADGDVTGSGEYIGGFVGDAYGTIEDSFATGDVTGTGVSEDEHGIGGFAGYLGGYLNNTYAEGNVSGYYQVGGLVGSTGAATSITNSYATGYVSGRDEIGGLVGRLDDYHVITNSYATGGVTGDDDIGGLVGNLQSGASITNSYATGDVTTTVEFEGGDIGGLIGYSEGFVSNSYARGDVSGFYDVGGLIGDLQSSGEIRNSYATGTVSAIGSDGNWSNGWGGLVGESSGLISNSYSTGDVVADYNFGSLIGYLRLDDGGPMQIENSFATGSTSRANNDVTLDGAEPLLGFGGFVGCAIEYNADTYNCYPAYEEFPATNPSILGVVNTAGTAGAPAFEIGACKNNGLPLLSTLIASYSNTCAPNPTTASLSVALASAVQLNPKFNLLESTTLRLFLYLVGDNTIRVTVEDFVVLGATGVNSKNLPVLLKLLKDVDLLALDLNTINKNIKIANEILKKQKKK